MTRQRSQPARVPPITDAVCPAGTYTMTSPGRFRPPVESSPVSHTCQPPPSHASHTSGGWRGSTPMPSTRLSRFTATMQRGTAVGRPNSSASPGWGAAWKAGMSWPSASSPVRSFCSPVRDAVTRRVNSLGTMRSSPVVVNTTASSASPPAVVTSVPGVSVTVSGCGADSQKSTSAMAAAGGNRRMPSRSRKAM